MVSLVSSNDTHVINTVYYILAGTGPNEGVIITRGRDGILNERKLDDENWYII